MPKAKGNPRWSFRFFDNRISNQQSPSPERRLPVLSLERGDGQIPLPVRLSRVPSVGPQGEEEEHRAQDILALCNPGDRLHIDRMKGEQRGHEQAGAKSARRPHQQPEGEDHIHRVQQDADEMTPNGILAKQREVQFVLHPGKRMPVRSFGRSQCPPEGFPGQTLTDVRILSDVTIVVMVYKRMAIDRVVERKRDHRENPHDGCALFG